MTKRLPSSASSSLPSGFADLLGEVKLRIQTAQTRAMFSVNAELIRLYWDIGHLIEDRQEREGWGASVIPRLSAELRNELPELKGFSERNIGHMIAFYRAYPEPQDFLQQAAAKLPASEKLKQAAARKEISLKVPQPAAQIGESLLWQIPWFHHVVLLQKVKDLTARRWYMEQTLANGWSRNVLTLMIESDAHRRTGKAISNFGQHLPAPQSDLVQQTLKDPYIFDFLTLEEPFHERELETELVRHLEKFLLELGQGFAFVGRQYRVTVGDDDFHIDLLFYHLRLRAFVVIDLKTGPFKPEYAGKLNFYCNVINDQLRHEHDQPTIGLILCQTKDNVLAEYALTGIDKPIGVSSYELTRALPKNLQSVLPTVEQIEAELSTPDTPSKSAGKKTTRKQPTKKATTNRKSKKQTDSTNSGAHK
jgi:predicted nuclease of restriction endonuclease-like (RecB) superfamily